MNYKKDYHTFDVDFKEASICLAQIEDSDVFSLEIFPVGQSEESFEEAEFHTFVNMKEYKETGEINIDYLNYPDDWKDEDIQQFWKDVEFEIKTNIFPDEEHWFYHDIQSAYDSYLNGEFDEGIFLNSIEESLIQYRIDNKLE
jgi:hypothetical protein